MINLLSHENKRQLAAARTNTLLLRYNLVLGILIVVIVLEIFAVYIVLNIGKTQNLETIRQNEAKAIGFTQTKQQSDKFKSDLSIAKYILDRQTPYSNMILTMANNLPSGATINKLDINPANFGTPTQLTVNTISYDNAISVKSSLQNIKINDIPLFNSVSFESVSSNTSDKSHPYTAVYNVTYSKSAL